MGREASYIMCCHHDILPCHGPRSKAKWPWVESPESVNKNESQVFLAETGSWPAQNVL